MRAHRLLQLVALVVLVLSAGACSPRPGDEPAPGAEAAPGNGPATGASPPAAPVAHRPARPARPDVVLISLDTLRCDALGPWRGPERPSVTPNLDALAAEGIVYSQAYAPIPWTLPSHMSILTGLPPDVHGVLTEGSVLSPKLTTLPEILQRLGYLTLGLATASWLDGAYGFARGFDFYRLLPGGLRPARVVNAGVAQLLGNRDPADARPLFLFLHDYDAHSDFADGGPRLPYYAPPELLPPGLEPSRLCHEGRCATDFLTAVNGGEVSLAAADLAAVTALYQAGVQALDGDLGVLFQFLRELGLWDSALVIVTSDHGEEFLEHGKLLHQQAYRETSWVPLLVKLPGGESAGARVETPVETVELAATVLAYLDVPSEPQLQGRDLLSLVGSPGSPDRPALTRGLARSQPRYFLRTRDRSFVFDPRHGRHQLFDLAVDPGETRDLAADRPREMAAFARLLAEMLRSHAELAARLGAQAGEGEVLNPKQRKTLKALGYLQ